MKQKKEGSTNLEPPGLSFTHHTRYTKAEAATLPSAPDRPVSAVREKIDYTGRVIKQNPREVNPMGSGICSATDSPPQRRISGGIRGDLIFLFEN